ncbi:hypothetical protein ACFFGH_08045 [Lysobacter korlensis]|uniref:Uncharacterized protein n=1 Tax=Lysobacter korlensis TaxID=553636 RepID=A0ABV6RN34_9GAMM
MSRPPDDVASLLYELESRLSTMLAASPSREDFWRDFEPHAQSVREAAGPERQAYAQTEIERMLSSQGLIPNPFDYPIDPIDGVTRDQ